MYRVNDDLRRLLDASARLLDFPVKTPFTKINQTIDIKIHFFFFEQSRFSVAISFLRVSMSSGATLWAICIPYPFNCQGTPAFVSIYFNCSNFCK